MSDLDLIAKAIKEREDKLRLAEEGLRKERAQIESDKKELNAALALRNRVLSGRNGDSQVAPEGRVSDVLVARGLMPKIEDRTSYGWFKKAILQVIDVAPADGFTSRDVVDLLEKGGVKITDANRANISAYLRDFFEQGLLTIVEGGSGRKPITFRKK